MKKLMVMCVAFAASLTMTYGVGITWSCTVGYVLNANGDPLAASQFDSTAGCFAQLLYAGANRSNDVANISDDGQTSDDVVIAKCWVGAGEASGESWFTAPTVPEGGGLVQTGGVYFIRVWNQPALNYASGYVPTNSTVRYIDSYLLPYPSVTPPSDITFDGSVNGDIRTTLTPVPEPGIFVLGLVGLISLRIFGRKRK
jgi:hypothetical protein